MRKNVKTANTFTQKMMEHVSVDVRLGRNRNSRQTAGVALIRNCCTLFKWKL